MSGADVMVVAAVVMVAEPPREEGNRLTEGESQ